MKASTPALTLRGSQRKLVLLPIGSCEQHGPYLPIDTDLRIAQLLAEKLEQSFVDQSSSVEPLLLPALPFSCSFEHHGPGTVALHVSTVAALLHDIARSLNAWKMPFLLVVVNWHGGNDLLASLATEISATEGISTTVIPSTVQVGRAWDESGITSAKDVHAGAIEASIVQAYWPELAPASVPETAHCEPQIAPAKTQAVLQAFGSYAVTREGIWGAPEQANPEKGKLLIETLVRQMHLQAEALLALADKYSQ